MREIVLAGAARLPVGRFGGSLREVGLTRMGSAAIREAIQRTGIPPDAVDEVVYAHGYRTGELPTNSARVVAVEAGVPVEKPQFTINKACGGGLKAIALCAQAIAAGEADVTVGGGMENMSRAAYLLTGARWGYRLGHGQLQDQLILFDPLSGCTMGQTAENIAKRYNISRIDQDNFALMSQRRAKAAIEAGLFKEQIIPVEIEEGKTTRIFDTDEHPRPDTTLEKLAKLPPAFMEGGSVTAGNSSGMNDCAAAVVVMAREKAKDMGVKPMASIVACASVGVEPSIMGVGPIPATRKVLEKANLKLDDIDLIELNEAFACQALACIRELGMDIEKVNVNGGAIALGHPISASGAVILVKLLYEMRRRESRYGLATLCIGGGQGIAIVVKNEL